MHEPNGAAQQGQPLLLVEHLRVAYAGVPALHDVSFAIYPGEVVTLVGANGAGKTTTLRSISGLVRAEAGAITLDGVELTNKPSHAITGLGIAHVPEGRRIFGRLTVEQNLLLGSYTPAARAAEARTKEEVLTLFPRLRERLGQRAGTLSGGEQQMLAIARGLMLRPRLLMLDEPSLGLAPLLVQGIFETIRQISASGVTILLVEQNVHESLSLAQRAYVLQVGEVVLAGSGAELLESDLVRQAYLGI
ncbi:MAG: ABC transporter ATP-binding protein [Chloroflexales bacterium]|nr:ABC transporter ATP-binding protein [Chloroflexales bacterium]